MSAGDRSFWGGLIRELRKNSGLTQRGLAVSAKVNRSTLRSIEAGDVAGDIDVVERLLAVFGYELEALNSQNESVKMRRAILVEAAIISLPKVGQSVP